MADAPRGAPPLNQNDDPDFTAGSGQTFGLAAGEDDQLNLTAGVPPGAPPLRQNDDPDFTSGSGQTFGLAAEDGQLNLTAGVPPGAPPLNQNDDGDFTAGQTFGLEAGDDLKDNHIGTINRPIPMNEGNSNTN